MKKGSIENGQDKKNCSNGFEEKCAGAGGVCGNGAVGALRTEERRESITALRSYRLRKTEISGICRCVSIVGADGKRPLPAYGGDHDSVWSGVAA